MTIVLPDIDVLRDLDFKAELPCEFSTCQPSPSTATHRYLGVTWCGCRHDYLICEAHSERVRNWLHETFTILCEHCSARRIGRLCDWMRLEPLS